MGNKLESFQKSGIYIYIYISFPFSKSPGIFRGRHAQCGGDRVGGAETREQYLLDIGTHLPGDSVLKTCTSLRRTKFQYRKRNWAPTASPKPETIGR